MQNNEGFFEVNAVIYFSCTGQSEKLAREAAEKLNYPLFPLNEAGGEFNNLILCFPVHCQGAPKAVKNFLKTTKAKYITLILTYGRMSAGNAVYEAYKSADGKVTAAAVIPARHGYNKEFKEAEGVPDEIYKKILNPAYIKIKRKAKAPFAGVLPALRSRLLIKINKNEACNGCNACGRACPQGAISCGDIKGGCIRCLKCVTVCPKGALEAEKGFILKSYLKKPRKEKTYIYV